MEDDSLPTEDQLFAYGNRLDDYEMQVHAWISQEREWIARKGVPRKANRDFVLTHPVIPERTI